MATANRLLRTALLAAVSGLALASLPAGAAQGESATGTRDWSAIDTDRDNYISPAEMQSYLEQVWQQKGKQG